MYSLTIVGLPGAEACHIQQPDFAGFDEAIGVLEIHTAISGGFDLGPCQNDSSFQSFQDLVIVKRLAIDSDVTHRPIWPGIAPPGSAPGPAGCAAGAGVDGNPTAGAGTLLFVGVTSGLLAPMGGGNWPGTKAAPGFGVFAGCATGA